MNIAGRFQSYMNEGHERSIKAKKNILALFIRKGLGIIISFLLVPVTIDYLNPTRYGIWLTISSFISWFYFFDIGLGNGLRNKFAEAMAKGDREKARIYVSTTYTILIIISAILFLSFNILHPFINWLKVFNVPPEYTGEINKVIYIVISFFCFQFVIQTIATILTADQRPAIAGYFNTIASLLSLFIIYILTKTTHGSLLYLSIAFSACNFIILFIATFWFFKGDYKAFRPSLKYVDFHYSKDLLNLGIKFFIIQASAIVIYSSSNMIITQLFTPADVTPYHIAFKYFSIITMAFAIFITPFWSAITEAYHKEDYRWIKNVMNKLMRIFAWTIILSVVMMIFANFMYRIWVGKEIKVPFGLTIIMGLYVIVMVWNNIFASFLNGVGKIKIQLYSAVLGGILNIPLAILFARYFHLGIAGIALSVLVLNVIGAIWSPYQYYLIIHKKAKGIWNE